MEGIPYEQASGPVSVSGRGVVLAAGLLGKQRCFGVGLYRTDFCTPGIPTRAGVHCGDAARRYNSDCSSSRSVTHSSREASGHIHRALGSALVPGPPHRSQDHQLPLLLHPYPGNNHLSSLAVPLRPSATVRSKASNAGHLQPNGICRVYLLALHAAEAAPRRRRVRIRRHGTCWESVERVDK